MNNRPFSICILILIISIIQAPFPASARETVRPNPTDIVITEAAVDYSALSPVPQVPTESGINESKADISALSPVPQMQAEVGINESETDISALSPVPQVPAEVVIDEPGTIYSPYVPADNPLWRADYASFDPLMAAFIRYTEPIPAAYKRPASQRGSVIELTYDSFDYTVEPPVPVQKPVVIYLPYGYEAHPKKRYDIIYLMHGWQGTAQDFLGIPTVVSLLDHLIEDEKLPPLILACPTVDAENKSQDWPRTLEEAMVFQKEVREVLLPFVESQVRTKAKKTSLKGLVASREHRGFIGFSMGGAVTWNQLLYNLDLFSFYAPMCGDCWIRGDEANYRSARKTVNRMEKLLKKWKKYDDGDYRILAAIGTKDDMRRGMDNQIREMYTRERFRYGNLRYLVKKDGRHDLDTVLEYVYNVLLEYRAS